MPTTTNGITTHYEEVTQVKKGMKRQRRQRQPPKPPELTPGSTVWLAGLKQSGQLLTTPDEKGRVEVKIGSLRQRVKAGEYQLTKETTSDSENEFQRAMKPTTGYKPRIHPRYEPPEELNLHGVEGLEAARKVDRHLDEAQTFRRAQVRINHGKGSGTLRKVVWEKLRRSPLVLIKSITFADPGEGGNGVTVAELAT